MTSLIRNLMAKGGMSFGHLGNVKAGPASSAKDDDKKDDDDSKSAKAEDDKSDDDDSGKGSKAETDDDKKGDDKDDKASKSAKSAKAEDDDAADDDDDGKKSAKADDDDEEEMRGQSAAASARRRERARCAAIFGSKAAGKNPVLAANLAFNTSMTRSEALTVLEGTPAPQQAGAQHANRAANNPRVDPPGTPEPNAHAASMASWDFARARNKKQGG